MRYAHEPEWAAKQREEAEAANKKAERQGLLIAIVVFAIITVAGIGLILWFRHSAPCWIFPLAEAPTRCLPGAVR